MKEYPEYFYIELTQNCNLYCTMCRPQRMADPTWFMSDELLDRIVGLALRHAKIVDLRGWGESSLDKRLIPTTRTLRDGGIAVRLYTNICANDSAYWASLADTGITLAISVESGNARRYAELRRGGRLEVMREHLRAFVSAAPASLPYFTVVVSEENLDELCSIVEMASEENLREIELNPISTRDDTAPSGRRTGLRACNQEHALRRLAQMDSLARQRGIAVKTAANLFSEDSIPQHICIHPWKYICVCYNGDVTFCDHLLHHKAAVMGNLCEQSLEEIWFGARYQSLREQHEKYEFDVLNAKGIECAWCCKNRYGNSEYLVQPGICPIRLTDYLRTVE